MGHKSRHCRSKNKDNKIRKLKSNEVKDGITRKFVTVEISNKNIKMQLDTGSDLSIINLHTWKKLGKPNLMKTKKIARSVMGEKIQFIGEFVTNVTLKNKTRKGKLFVIENTTNLLGTNWITKFQLWDLPMNSFCYKVESLNTEAPKLIKKLKETFPTVFSPGLGTCTKMEEKFQLKENAQVVFKKKRNVPFASIEQIDKELDKLEKTGVLKNVEYSEGARL